ncbi:Hypothetical protein, putative [Bodo saltans]|uniref:Uncharacterized protein n=1 Tax=Bodo saltans TaxID=75058 RepID=A0A0S4J7H8_BODSA|nr:Hypothetical protein, putative [Bodo saltans]|eukprot:CUG85843.1 Hypothetical protein, putative [Bodo saltans]
MFMKTSSSTFGVNLVQGGDSSLGCYSSWLAGNGQVSVQCEMDSQSFGVQDRFIIGNDDKDCYMTQTIDITYARNYLLNPGGRVTIHHKEAFKGYATLTLLQLECGSGFTKCTLGGVQLLSNSWQTYTWTTQLLPNICNVSVQLYLRNHKADGDIPRAQTVSVVLAAVPATTTNEITKTDKTITLTPGVVTTTQTATVANTFTVNLVTLSESLTQSSTAVNSITARSLTLSETITFSSPLSQSMSAINTDTIVSLSLSETVSLSSTQSNTPTFSVTQTLVFTKSNSFVATTTPSRTVSKRTFARSISENTFTHSTASLTLSPVMCGWLKTFFLMNATSDVKIY